MAQGIDANFDCSGIAACLQAAGITFVGRYYKFGHGSEPLTPDEARNLTDAGLFIVAIYESGRPTSVDYFSRSRGVHDGTAAYHYALETIHQPPGTPIYFAVDYDAARPHLVGAISDYFRGIRDGFATISDGHPVYEIGVYGSGLTCRWLRSHLPFVTHTWLAESTGWAEHATYADWNIKQRPGAAICGQDSGTIDSDESSPAGGGGFHVR